jgi:hypothetical protein
MEVQSGRSECEAPQEAQFFLRNLSYSGMMAEFIAGYGPQGTDKGSEIRVTHAPGALKDVLVDVRGVVVWTAGGVCGICFEEQLAETTPSLKERVGQTSGGAWTS